MSEGTVAEHLRQWIAAARGAIEWHLETGDVDLPVPGGFRAPPLGDIADGPLPVRPAAPARLAPSGSGSSPASSAGPQGAGPSAAMPQSPVGLPSAPAPVGQRADAGGFARLAEAAGAAAARATSRPSRGAGSAAASPVTAATDEAAAPVQISGDGPAAAAAALRVLQDEIGDCTRCPLHQGRTELVFGAGHPRARVLFVGDQPGKDDDQLGLPFVDGAGQLLGRMVRAMGLARSQVYLTHLVKCHDPEQGPEPGVEACGGFLARQIEAVQPQIIIALGGVAARQLTGVREQLPHLRGRWHEHAGVPVLATFHPNALAQHPQSKRQVWTDLKMAMRRLGLPLPGRRG